MKKKILVTAIASVMIFAVSLTALGAAPESGTANNNSFLNDTIFSPNVGVFDQNDVPVGRATVESVRIGGNGNSARLMVKISGVEYATTARPINNTVNTVTAGGFEIDVFVRGNKIDGVLGVWDLNCYCEGCENAPMCDPTRDEPCIVYVCECSAWCSFCDDCSSSCVWCSSCGECSSSAACADCMFVAPCTCYTDWLNTNVCPPCRNGVGNNHSNCHADHHVHGSAWGHCQCCGPNPGSNPFIPNDCCK